MSVPMIAVGAAAVVGGMLVSDRRLSLGLQVGGLALAAYGVWRFFQPPDEAPTQVSDPEPIPSHEVSGAGIIGTFVEPLEGATVRRGLFGDEYPVTVEIANDSNQPRTVRASVVVAEDYAVFGDNEHTSSLGAIALGPRQRVRVTTNVRIEGSFATFEVELRMRLIADGNTLAAVRAFLE